MLKVGRQTTACQTVAAGASWKGLPKHSLSMGYWAARDRPRRGFLKAGATQLAAGRGRASDAAGLPAGRAKRLYRRFREPAARTQTSSRQSGRATYTTQSAHSATREPAVVSIQCSTRPFDLHP